MPSKYSDTQYIRDSYHEAVTRAQSERHTFEREWFRNVLYYIGIQWIYYDIRSKKWVPRNLKKWVPRPVTNKFAMHGNTIMQVLGARPPNVIPRPATDHADDIAAAEIAGMILPVLHREAGADHARKQAATWLTLTGNVFLHSCYDTSDISAGTTFIQDLQCSACAAKFGPDQYFGECPKCGITKPPVPLIDEAGQPVGEEVTNGRLKKEVFSPFEVHLDLEARSMDEIQELLIRRRYPTESVKQRYKLTDDQLVESESPGDESAGTGLSLLKAIAYASGSTAYAGGTGAGTAANIQKAVTVDYYWKRPCGEFPDGLVAVIVNDQIVNESDLKDGIPYKDRKGKPIWPWHHLKFDPVAGRMLGKTPLDDIAPKQEQRNKLESLIQLIITRNANPVWLIQKNIGITQITGEPGQVVEGNWGLDPNKAKPDRIPGENVPTSVVAWLEKIDSDMEQMAGTFEVLKGSAPPGISAGTALRLLLERAVTRFSPVIEEFERVWGMSAQDDLVIFQQFGTEERIAQIEGPGKTWETKRFKRSDIAGSVDIIVEAGSAVPKNTVGVQALIQDMVGIGAIDPTNPETRYQILKEFGHTSLLGEVDESIKHAERENWFFQNEGAPPKLNPLIDDHMTHMTTHRKLARTSDFTELPDEMQVIWLIHILQHQQQMMMMMGGAPMGASPGGNGSQPTGEEEGKPPLPGVPPGSPASQEAQEPPPFPGFAQ